MCLGNGWTPQNKSQEKVLKEQAQLANQKATHLLTFLCCSLFPHIALGRCPYSSRAHWGPPRPPIFSESHCVHIPCPHSPASPAHRRVLPLSAVTSFLRPQILNFLGIFLWFTGMLHLSKKHLGFEFLFMNNVLFLLVWEKMFKSFVLFCFF